MHAILNVNEDAQRQWDVNAPVDVGVSVQLIAGTLRGYEPTGVPCFWVVLQAYKHEWRSVVAG